MSRACSTRLAASLLSAALLLAAMAPASAAVPVASLTTRTTGAITMIDEKTSFTYDRGCVIRGRRDRKIMAVQFTGGGFADGGTTILDELRKRGIKATFYFTGDFYRTPEFRPLIERVRNEGHYLGPHGDKHLLYATWENPPKLLVTREQFDTDMDGNIAELAKFGIPPSKARFWNPAYQHFTPEVVEWTKARGMVMVNYTPGTYSHADYMEDDDPKYVPSTAMVKSVLDYEKKDPDGLNGFILHMHIGAGPKRTKDHLYDHLGAMLDELIARGYSFTRVDDLVAGAK